MNLFTQSSVIQITHLQIVELVQKHPDNVKRTIESLVNPDVVIHPQIKDKGSCKIKDEEQTKFKNGDDLKVYSKIAFFILSKQNILMVIEDEK